MRGSAGQSRPPINIRSSRRGDEPEKGCPFRRIYWHCDRAGATARIIHPVAAQAHAEIVSLRLELEAV